LTGRLRGDFVDMFLLSRRFAKTELIERSAETIQASTSRCSPT